MDTLPFFNAIKNHLQSNHPLVVYTKPHSTTVTALLQKTVTSHYIEDYSESGFVMAPFDTKKKTFYIPFDQSDCLELHGGKWTIKNTSANLSSQIKGDEHIKLVENALASIRSTSLEKVVLSHSTALDVGASDGLTIFKNLLQLYPSAFTYMWYHPETGLWIGASPETLLQIKGRSFHSMALAGTQSYTGLKPIQWDQKNIDEQAFVTNYLLKVLAQNVDHLKASVPETQRAGDLVHIKTVISGRLKDHESTLKNLIVSLHPTPAICGTPKAEALNFILENEGYDREFYSGVLGELNSSEKQTFKSAQNNIEHRAYQTISKTSHLFVNLRCMKLIDNTAWIYTGGGITKDSNPQQEWEEIQNKQSTIKNAL